jgi:hypothetical protein
MQPADHHDVPAMPVPAHLVTSWPVGTFVENIALLPDGDFVVSLHNRHELVRVGRDGTTSLLAILPASPAGVVAAADGVFVAAGEPGSGPHAIFHVGFNGSVRRLLDVPNTLFLNGFTPARPGFAYCVDSIMGSVYEIDFTRAAARVVLTHELLGKISADPMMPGVNGIKLGDDALWLTNTDRALILRAAMDGDGPDGTLDVVAEHLRGDDLALDKAGNLYITTHIHNTLIRLARDGDRVALAGPDQGLHGATACAFGPAPDDDDALFATTTGGIVMPVDGITREAKLVRLDVGAPGRPLPIEH